MADTPVPPLDAVTPPTDWDWHPRPFQMHTLWVYALRADRVNDIDVPTRTIGAVADGVDTLLAEWKRGEVTLPATYTDWDAEFGDARSLLLDTPVYTGAVARKQGTDQQVQLCLRSDLCRAAFRVLTGGGRYTASAYTVHDATLVFVVEDGEHAVAVAPTLRRPSEDAAIARADAEAVYTVTDDNRLAVVE